MRAIISDIEQLRRTAKVNNSLEFEVVEPYLQQARDFFLVRYLGETLVSKLEEENPAGKYKELLEKTRLCIGPMALWLGNAELSARIGDSGFTVEKREGGTSGAGYVPASDTKIGKIEESHERRAFGYLDIILAYLEENATEFPEWKHSRYYTLRNENYIASAKQFQEIGLVDIDYSRLTFEHFRPAMRMIEVRFIAELIGDELDQRLRTAIQSENLTPAESKITQAIRRFIACKTAEIHTSEKARTNRSSQQEKEYKPFIRPIYQDPEYTGNFFADQSEFYLSKIAQLMNDLHDELGIEYKSHSLDFNSKDNKIFVDIG